MRFSAIADYFERIENASSRLDMTGIIAEMFGEAEAKEVKRLVYLCQGRLGPNYEGLDVGMGENFVEDAIARVGGYSREEIDRDYKELGDLGLAAEKVLARKKQKALFSEQLSLDKVFSNLLKIAKSGGKGSQDTKIKLLAELLNSASPKEARYLVRVPLGNLRLGTGDPTIMDAFAIMLIDEVKKDKKKIAELERELKEKKEEKREEELNRKIKFLARARIEEKYNIHSDLGEIAERLKEKGLGGLDRIEITPGIPIRPTLAERLPSAEEIIKKLGKCAVESKYDGFRLQLHKFGDDVTIFSRRSENMTAMFPELVEAVRKQIKAREAILEGEALAYSEESGEFHPFQVTIQRKRKYGVKKMSEEFPLRLFVFDIMHLDGKNLMGRKFRERRALINRIIGRGTVIEPTKSIITGSPEELESFFEENISRGLEGIIAKDLDAPYIAGARKFAWIKLKRSYKGELGDTIDAVVMGYYEGRGQRAKFGMGALLTGVYDAREDRFRTIAKIGTGFTEEQMKEFAKTLGKIKSGKKPARYVSGIEPDFWVEPRYVIEVNADEITKSPMHTAGKKGKGDGLALRFPRMVSVREDRKAEEATTVKEIEKMYKAQKHTSTGEEK